jgi:hypothetical protein
MPCWQAKVSACCISCSSYALKAASRRSCCVRCSGLLLLVTLKRQSTHTPLRSLFDKHRVWQNRRQHQRGPQPPEHGTAAPGGTLLMRAELTFKQDYGQSSGPNWKVFLVALPQGAGRRFY